MEFELYVALADDKLARRSKRKSSRSGPEQLGIDQLRDEIAQRLEKLAGLGNGT